MAPRRDNTFNTLFTSVGRRVELVRAFQHAYQTLGLRGDVIGIDIDPLAPALRVANRSYIVPRLESAEYVPALLRICREERIDLIFPLIDPDVPILAKNRPALEALGVRLAVVSEEAAATVADKWNTLALFESANVPRPRSWLPGELDPERAEYPLFIKPRCGSAAKHTFKVGNARELAFFVDYVPNPILQEYVAGPEITSDVVCDLRGQVLAVVSRKRLEVRSGEVAKGVTVYHSAIAAACIRLAEALPAIGPITVQCLMREGVPLFTEINARLSGGFPLGIQAGVDSPRLVLARAAGLDVDLPPLGAYQLGLYLTRFDASFFLTEAEREQMAGRRL
ncbi:MAG TPA: ATP-grasp domain-containing protein [Gemmataceae bacterium]|nr:ATP-grasp domain-containing protein [Gemmataceae bacterium]